MKLIIELSEDDVKKIFSIVKALDLKDVEQTLAQLLESRTKDKAPVPPGFREVL